MKQDVQEVLFPGQSYFSFMVKQKKYLTKNITHSFTYTELFLGGMGGGGEKALTYVSPNATYI